MTEQDYLVERWRKPVRIFAAQHDPDGAVRFGEGDGWREGVRWVTDQEGFARMWAGQVCHVCTEPQPPPAPNPPPEHCSVCGYRIRAEQRRDMLNGAVGFKGEERLGGSTSIAQELDRLDDFGDRFRWEQHPTTGIVIPRGVS